MRALCAKAPFAFTPGLPIIPCMNTSTRIVRDCRGLPYTPRTGCTCRGDQRRAHWSLSSVELAPETLETVWKLYFSLVQLGDQNFSPGFFRVPPVPRLSPLRGDQAMSPVPPARDETAVLVIPRMSRRDVPPRTMPALTTAQTHPTAEA